MKIPIQRENKMSEENVKVAVLQQKLEDLKHIVIKLDDAIEKLSEVNINVGKMLAVHEQRITTQEETDNEIMRKVDNLSEKINNNNQSTLTKIQNLEKKVWIGIGIITCIVFFIDNIEMFSSALTRSQPNVIIQERIEN
jgi:tetrahydromethanopterin S-methyltransferase subunit G